MSMQSLKLEGVAKKDGAQCTDYQGAMRTVSGWKNSMLFPCPDRTTLGPTQVLPRSSWIILLQAGYFPS